MGNVVSKMCKFLSKPIRYYEKRKVEKIYKEVFQDDTDNIPTYPDEACI